VTTRIWPISGPSCPTTGGGHRASGVCFLSHATARDLLLSRNELGSRDGPGTEPPLLIQRHQLYLADRTPTRRVCTSLANRRRTESDESLGKRKDACISPGVLESRRPDSN
jgi:hypothetical protein